MHPKITFYSQNLFNLIEHSILLAVLNVYLLKQCSERECKTEKKIITQTMFRREICMDGMDVCVVVCKIVLNHAHNIMVCAIISDNKCKH